MWVLTKCANDYNQHGDYFVSVFDKYPTSLQLMDIIDESEEYCQHVIENKGGRKDAEDVWWHLSEISFGEKYNSFSQQLNTTT